MEILDNVKEDIKRQLGYYWRSVDMTKQCNEKSLNNNMYSQEYKDEILKEQNAEIEEHKRDFYKKVREMKENYISQLKPNTKVIDTMEYQIKLANIIKLVEMSEGAISEDSLKFMVEANHTDALRILSNKFNTTSLTSALIKSDLSNIKSDIEALCQSAENHIGYEMLGASRESILSSFN